MLRFCHGDLFTSQAQTLVNPVNCVGVMGKGLALAFRRRFPAMYVDYVARCRRGEVRPGRPYLFTGTTPWILNFPTKDHWRNPSRLTFIEDGLKALVDQISIWGIHSLALPALGCGLGQLSWEEVRPLLVRYLQPLPIPVEVYLVRSRR